MCEQCTLIGQPRMIEQNSLALFNWKKHIGRTIAGFFIACKWWCSIIPGVPVPRSKQGFYVERLDIGLRWWTLWIIMLRMIDMDWTLCGVCWLGMHCFSQVSQMKRPLKNERDCCQPSFTRGVLSFQCCCHSHPRRCIEEGSSESNVSLTAAL